MVVNQDKEESCKINCKNEKQQYVSDGNSLKLLSLFVKQEAESMVLGIFSSSHVRLSLYSLHHYQGPPFFLWWALFCTKCHLP